MAESRVNLGAGAPGGYSFGIAGYGVRPRVFVEGRQTGRTPSVALPEGDVLLDINNQNYYGKIGVDVTSPGGDTFGGAASGSYYRGSVDFPEELQRYGTPDRETYSARGIQSPEYSGYYQMEGGPRFEGYYRDMPEGSGMPDEYGGRVSYTIPFKDGGKVEPRGMAESRVDLGAGSPNAGEVGYYPEGPPKKLSEAEADVQKDIDDLAPFLEDDYLAQLGLDSLSLDQILRIDDTYSAAGFYAPRDGTIGKGYEMKRADQKAAVKELRKRGRDPFGLVDPSLKDTGVSAFKDFVGYSFPTPSDGSEGPELTRLQNRRGRKYTEEESRQAGLSTLAHELGHAGDHYLTRMLGVDDDIKQYDLRGYEVDDDVQRDYSGPPLFENDIGETYARLMDIVRRDRGLAPAQSPAEKDFEGTAVMRGIPSRYEGDPFAASVRNSPFEELAETVLNHPVQDAARRELLRRMAERTPTGGYEEGGEVEPMGIAKSVTITQAIPATDPRSAALGSRLLKQAGFRGDFNAVLKNADPRVVDQVNRIMPKSKVAASSTGLGLFMQSTTKAI